MGQNISLRELKDWWDRPGLIEPGQIWEHWTGIYRVRIQGLSETGKYWETDSSDPTGPSLATTKELLNHFFVVGRVSP